MAEPQRPTSLASKHPSAVQLAEFGQGLIAPTEAVVIEEHLAGCDVCCRALVEVPDAPLVGMLRAAASRPSTDDAQLADTAARPAAPPLEKLGDYRILREVGRGGMGVVYEAEQQSLRRHVALKVLAGSAVLDAGRLERFKREARSAARLHHTNIVPVYGVGEQDGLHYYVMQYIQGQGLDQVLAEVERRRLQPVGAASRVDGIDPTEAVATFAGRLAEALLRGQSTAWAGIARIGIQVAEALAYASSQGVLHRDIKLSNLLVDDLGTVWVTDFGLAKAASDADDLTHTGDIVGTLRYMAPERFQGKADVRSDVYALGLALHELLTLKPAFGETDRNKLMAQVLHEQPPRPRKLNPAIPRDLETIVLKATGRDPAHRYQTPAELAEDLQRFLDDRPIKARRLGLLQLGWRWARRNPVIATLGSALAVSALVIAVGSPIMLLNLSNEQARTLKELQRAEKAEEDGKDRLWDSKLAEAHALRWSGQAGRHFKSLDAIAEAAKIRTSPELRNEAVACIPLVDLRVFKRWPVKPGQNACIDPSLKNYALNNNGTITIHRVSDDEEIARLPGMHAPVNWMALSPKSEYLVYTNQHNSPLIVWALDPVREVLRYDPTNSGWHVMRPDNRQLAVCTKDGRIRFYDLPSGQLTNELSLGEKQLRVHYHPNGQQLAVDDGVSNVYRMVDLDSGEELDNLPHVSPADDLGWSPDGRFLAVPGWATPKGGRDVFHVLDSQTGKLQAALVGHQNTARSCMFNHRGDMLASWGYDGATRLWDPYSGKELVSIPGSYVQFSLDDRYLVYTDDKYVGILEIATGHECRTFYPATATEKQGPWSVDISPQGRLLASSHNEGVRLWDLATGKELALLPTGKGDAQFDPSGDTLITSGATGCYRWPIATDPQRGVLMVGPPQKLADAVGRSLLRRAGRWLGGVSGASEYVVVNLDKPAEKVRLSGHAGASHFDISPDGRWIATGCQHGEGIKVWDARTGQVEREIAGGGYGWPTFSPDGKYLATVTTGHDTELWEVGSWRRKHHWAYPDMGGEFFSRDGTVMAIKHTRLTLTTLVDVETGKELATLPAPQMLQISDISFSPDGSVMAVGCYGDGVVQVWDLRAIRARLKEMNLDWEARDYPPAEDPAGQKPMRVEVVKE